jgi:hypothetical protein
MPGEKLFWTINIYMINNIYDPWQFFTCCLLTRPEPIFPSRVNKTLSKSNRSVLPLFALLNIKIGIRDFNAGEQSSFFYSSGRLPPATFSYCFLYSWFFFGGGGGSLHLNVYA